MSKGKFIGKIKPQIVVKRQVVKDGQTYSVGIKKYERVLEKYLKSKYHDVKVRAASSTNTVTLTISDR